MRSGQGNRKRSRNRSDGSQISPDKKRNKLCDTSVTLTENSEDTTTMSENQEQEPRSDKGVSDALNAKLDAIVQGQQQMRADFNNNFSRQEVRLAELISSKLSGLRLEIDTKLATICEDLPEVQQRVSALEVQGAAAAAANDAHVMEGSPTADVAELRQRLDTLEAAANGRSRDTLIVKGLVETEGETMEDLLQSCQQLLNQLQVNALVTAAQRMGNEERGRKPRVVTMTLPSQDAVRQVMKNKRTLKDSQAYSRVYIEPDRPQEIRALEANVRRLARDNPSLEIRRGPLVDKAQPGRNAQAPAGA